MHSYALEYEYESEALNQDGSKRFVTISGEVKRDGRKLWIVWEQVTKIPEKAEEKRFYGRSVLNDDYLLLWPGMDGIPFNNYNVFRHDHLSMDEMSEENLNRYHSEIATNPMRYGWGSEWGPDEPTGLEGDTLRALRERNGDRVEWKVLKDEDEAAGALYRIQLRGKGRPESPMTEIVISEAQGFLVTEINRVGPDGWVQMSTKIKGREVAPGVWMPFEIDQFRNRISSRKRDATIRIQVKAVEVDIEFEESQFRLKAFEFPHERMKIARVKVDGTAERLVYYQGRFVPEELVFSIRMAERVPDEWLKNTIAPPPSEPPEANGEPVPGERGAIQDETPLDRGGQRLLVPGLAALSAMILIIVVVLYSRKRAGGKSA